jgi:hypothetical protein
LGFCGIAGRPYVDLSQRLDTSPLAEIDAEIALGLTSVATSCTGGSLKWMGVVAPPVQAEREYADAMHAVARFSRDEFVRFVSLADDPSSIDPDRQAEYAFGDETDHPLSTRQMRYLQYRHGVYFPWKVAYHLLENVWWDDKNLGAGKSFRRDAVQAFPRTVAYIRSLPFLEIGRVVLFGLESNDHAPLHRDTVPRAGARVEHCITICPRRDKRFYLADRELRERVHVDASLYWFNDMDWHGVEPDPFFRYSIRVDGVFEPGFAESLLGPAGAGL